MHILGVRVLHDIIREFARDSFPSNTCNFVRDVAACILRRCPWGRGWTFQADPEASDDDRRGEWYLQRHLEHRFVLSYHGHGLVRVHHRTIADSEGYRPSLTSTVLVRESRNVPDDIRADVYEARFDRWKQSVRGRNWTAECADDWHMWPRAKIEANPTLSWLFFSEGYVTKQKGEKIDHIVDLSTLTLLRD